MTPDKRVEEIVRQTHTFLPLDLKDREEFLQYLETALTQYHQDMMSEVVEELEGLKKVENVTSEFETLEDYEDRNTDIIISNQALTEAQTIIKSK